jgi:hypothetical protein
LLTPFGITAPPAFLEAVDELTQARFIELDVFAAIDLVAANLDLAA